MKHFLALLVMVVSTYSTFAQVSTSNIIEKYQSQSPKEWGENVHGVKTRLSTTEKVIALTLDACGSATDGCDYRYIHFLEEEKIPATIFVSNRWIMRHPDDFKKLIKNPLFDIENHGLHHKPCSVNGKSIYGIQGTQNITELIAEIENNAHIIQEHTGKKPKFYRSGTAYYDEIATHVANDLGYQVIGFTVLGDAGTTWNKGQVKKALLETKPGSIIILHMNHPEKECAEGAIEALKELQKRGFTFVRLSQYSLT